MSEMKRIATAGLELLGSGRTASVYSLSDKEVLKVFLPTYAPEKTEREFQMTRKIHDAGIPCADALERVMVCAQMSDPKEKDVHGIIYEKVSSANIYDQLGPAMMTGRMDEVSRLLDYYVEFGRKLHGITLPEGYLTDIRERYIELIREATGSRLEEGPAERLIAAIRSIPYCPNYLHGDFNFSNVPAYSESPKLYDVGSAAQGDPAFDLYFLYTGDFFEQALPGFVMRTYGLTLEQADMLRDIVTERVCRGKTDAEKAIFRKRATIVGLAYLIVVDYGMAEFPVPLKMKFGQIVDSVLASL